ncbi:MAG: DUF3124 domain-containing protein [Salinivenus sp.]
MPTLFPRRRLLLLLGLVLLAPFWVACQPSSPTEPNVEPPPSHLDSLVAGSAAPADQGSPTKRVRSQTLYVPAYSHIYIRDAQRTMNLATTLSIRNTSPEVPLTLSTIDYYDSNGDPVRSYLDTARILGPLASTYVVVDVSDIRGGVGANFLLRWHAEQPVPPPVVETVMVTGANTQGISFRSTARVLREERVSPDTLGQRSDPHP